LIFYGFLLKLHFLIYMDEPLFGERKQSTKLFIWGAVAIIVGLALFTATVAIINGFRVNKFHFGLAAAVLIFLAGLGVLFKWWNGGDLDPKFNYLLLYFVFAFICVCVACQFYIWEQKPIVIIPPTCGPDNMGLYVIQTGTCFYNVTNQCFNQANGCVCASLDYGSGSYTCANCTSCFPSKSRYSLEYNYWNPEVPNSNNEYI